MRIHPPPNPSPDPPESGKEPVTIDERIIAAIRTVYDPEIPINIYELGLIYKVDFNEETGRCFVLMTLTTPNCPEAQYLPGAVKSAVETVPEVKEAEVQITWEPKWDREMMSDAAKLQLGML